jgi:hypothetical protein
VHGESEENHEHLIQHSRFAEVGASEALPPEANRLVRICNYLKQGGRIYINIPALCLEVARATQNVSAHTRPLDLESNQ